MRSVFSHWYLGEAMRDSPMLAPAGLFYLAYAGNLVFLVFFPGVAGRRTWAASTSRGGAVDAERDALGYAKRQAANVVGIGHRVSICMSCAIDSAFTFQGDWLQL